MKLLHRFGYYFGGFAVGLVLLAFFLNGKRVSCDYGPEARVLKNINSKNLVYSIDALAVVASENIDSTQINFILYKGDINFSKSDTRKKPCGEYYIEGTLNEKDAVLIVENCKNKSILTAIKFID